MTAERIPPSLIDGCTARCDRPSRTARTGNACSSRFCEDFGVGPAEAAADTQLRRGSIADDQRTCVAAIELGDRDRERRVEKHEMPATPVERTFRIGSGARAYEHATRIRERAAAGRQQGYRLIASILR